MLFAAWFFLLVSFQNATSAPASKPATQDAADVILEAAIEARGGRAVLDAPEFRYFEGNSVASNGDQAALRCLVRRDGRYWMRSVSRRGDVFAGGFDGSAYWSADSARPEFTQQLERESADYKRISAAFDAMLDYKLLFPMRELLESENVDGIPVYVLRLTTSIGRAETWYVDEGSKKLVRIKRTYVTSSGVRVPTTVSFRDFRRVDGILTPFAVTESGTTSTGTFELQTTFAVISHSGQSTGDREFDIPSEVRTQIEKNRRKSEATTRPASAPTRGH